jgi:hypothetical protein
VINVRIGIDIGEVMDAINNPEKQSLIYHDGKYWSLQSLIKPSQEERERMRLVLEKYKK